MITVIDYKAGNLTSVKLAFESLGVEARITDRAEDVLAAEKLIFPGVGAAGASMDTLRRLKLDGPIKRQIAAGVPTLVICVGMQLLFDYSEENDNTPCLGIVPGAVKRFVAPEPSFKIPQMGWNSVKFAKPNPHPLLAGIEDESEFYFVHSYYPAPTDSDIVLARTEYSGANFSSVIGRDNFMATQFHPEKSGRIGLQLLKNFSQWEGKC